MPTRAEHQAGLNAMPSAAEVAGTESLDNGLAMETLVFPAYPISKHHVQVVHHFDKLGLAKLVLVSSGIVQGGRSELLLDVPAAPCSHNDISYHRQVPSLRNCSRSPC